MAINDHFRDMMMAAAYIQGCNLMAADDGWFVVVNAADDVSLRHIWKYSDTAGSKE